MDPSNHDKALLSRLNALKPSSISLSSTSSPFPPSEQNPNITTRFHSLKSAPNNKNNRDALIASIAEAPNNENEDAPPSPTVEELLADLGPEEQWRIDGEEGEKISQLMAEARGVLVSCQLGEEDEKRREGGVDPLSKEEKDRGKEEEGDKGESRRDDDDEDEEEAARQLQRILDELDVEDTDPRPIDEGSRSPHHELDSLPSTPIHPAHAHATTTSTNKTTTTLTLPSVPLTHPSPPKTHPQPSKNKDPTSTWCTICLADATVRCPGCGDDLYCWGCWNEGHVGEGAGWEETGHRWVGVGEGGGGGRKGGKGEGVGRGQS